MLKRETGTAEALQHGGILGVRELPHHTQMQEKGKVEVSQQWSGFSGGEIRSRQQSLAESQSWCQGHAMHLQPPFSSPFPRASRERAHSTACPEEKGQLVPAKFSRSCRFRPSSELSALCRATSCSPCPKSPNTFQLSLGAMARTALDTSTAAGTALLLLSALP